MSPHFKMSIKHDMGELFLKSDAVSVVYQLHDGNISGVPEFTPSI